MTLATELLSSVSTSLLDDAERTWSEEELFGYLNRAVAQVCGTLLDVYVVTNVVALTAGPRQELPADGVALIDIPRDGNGNGVTQQALNELARTRPQWAATAQSEDIAYFMYDRRSPRTYLVYPPAGAGATVELVYAAIPPVMTYPNDEIPIPATFDTALWAYVLALAYAKNSKRQDMAKSTGYMGLYTQVISEWKKIKDGTVASPDLRGVR